ncbi:MAG: histidine kinase, partial [Chloroflexota bacterium]
MSYAAVTVGVFVTLELILLGVLGIWLIVLVNSGALPKQLIEVGAQYTPVLRTYLTQSPPDQVGIAESLEWIRAATSQTIPLSFDATDKIIVIGADGTLLGSSPANLLGADAIGQSFDPESVPGVIGPLEAALAGTQNIERLYSVDSLGDQVVIAIPVWDRGDSQVLGAVIGIAELPTVWSITSESLPILGISLLLFTLLAVLTGTPFGYLAARGLVKRFDRLSEATQAWSLGDFSKAVDDSSEDELGQLAHRLNSMANQLQNLLDSRRQLAVVEERNRLARDLHDSVKQQAFAAAAQLDAVEALIGRDPDTASGHVREAIRLVDDLRRELTALIEELRPVHLQDKGLARALTDYLTGWSRQNEIKSEVLIQGERSIPSNVEQALFRIAQEALSNVARHSHATQVDILLTYNTNMITLTVSDDGQGIEVDDKNQGLGLLSMRERAASLDGQVIIENLSGQGTR